MQIPSYKVSHWDIMYSMGDVVNNTVKTLVTDDN